MLGERGADAGAERWGGLGGAVAGAGRRTARGTARAVGAGCAGEGAAALAGFTTSGGTVEAGAGDRPGSAAEGETEVRGVVDTTTAEVSAGGAAQAFARSPNRRVRSFCCSVTRRFASCSSASR